MKDCYRIAILRSNVSSENRNVYEMENNTSILKENSNQINYVFAIWKSDSIYLTGVETIFYLVLSIGLHIIIFYFLGPQENIETFLQIIK